MLFRANEITLKSCDTMAGKLIKLFDVALDVYDQQAHVGHCACPELENFSNDCNGLRFADVRLFCSFLMTFGKNIESIFVKTTWLVYREEYLSKFKLNCYLTSKKSALTEMAMEPF